MRLRSWFGLASLGAALVPAFHLARDARARAAGSDCELVEHDYGPRGTVPLEVQVWTRGLEVPWSLAFLPDGAALVSERGGRIRYVDPGGRLQKQPVATFPAAATEEGGVLGLAVDPAFGESGLVFSYQTIPTLRGPPRNRIERFRLSEDDHRALLRRVIFTDIPAARFHDGGRLRFGPDGMLYASTGDAGDPSSARDLSSRAGKILRLSKDGSIPADNPWPHNPVFIRGIRNTEAFDWLNNSALYVADNGPTGEFGLHGYDEVTLAGAASDLGWPAIWGCRSRPGMVTPSLSWREAVPPGGAVLYRGSAIPEWRGDLIVGTLGSKHLHRVAFAPDDPRQVRLHEVYLAGDPPQGYGRLRDVVVGPDGALYVTTSNCDGRGRCPADGDYILRIVRKR